AAAPIRTCWPANVNGWGLTTQSHNPQRCSPARPAGLFFVKPTLALGVAPMWNSPKPFRMYRVRLAPLRRGLSLTKEAPDVPGLRVSEQKENPSRAAAEPLDAPILSQGTNHAKARGSAIYAAGRLIHYFDRISANGLERLVTVRGEVIKRLRLEEGLCLLKVIPFRNCHALGWGRPLHADNFSATRAEITTSCFCL